MIIENGRLFLTRRPPGDKLAGLWELPGGKVEAGETPQQCLARELREELGMDAMVGDVLAETDYEYAHGDFHMMALRTSRGSDFQLLAHDRFAWVEQGDVDDYPLAPADIVLVRGLVERGLWPA